MPVRPVELCACSVGVPIPIFMLVLFPRPSSLTPPRHSLFPCLSLVGPIQATSGIRVLGLSNLRDVQAQTISATNVTFQGRANILKSRSDPSVKSRKNWTGR